jgi:hypothetical protein
VLIPCVLFVCGLLLVSTPVAAGAITGGYACPPLNPNDPELCAVVSPPSDGSVGYFFEFGTTGAFGQTIPAASVREVGVSSGEPTVEVRASVSGLQPSTTYHYRVVAVTESGVFDGVDMIFTTPSEESVGPLEGSPLPPAENPVTPFEPPMESWVGSSAGAGAERELAAAKVEQEARERAQWLASPQYREEQERKEVQVKEEETRAQEAVERRVAQAQRCVVPALKGDSLALARAAVRRAHCRLGRVLAPRIHHGLLVVIRQSVRAGLRRHAAATVAIQLGPPSTRRSG